MAGRRLAIVTLLAGLFLLLTGFFEPVPVVLTSLQKKMSGWTALSVTGARTRLDLQAGTQTRQEFHLRLERPKKMRLDMLPGPEEGAARSPEGLSEPAKRAFDLLLLASDKVKLYARLKEWGIAAQPSGLTRLDRTVCISIGATEGEPERPQFWVEKFTAFPARLMFTLDAGGQPRHYDVRFTGWDLPAAQELFPQTIAIHEEGKLIEKWELNSVEKASGAH